MARRRRAVCGTRWKTPSAWETSDKHADAGEESAGIADIARELKRVPEKVESACRAIMSDIFLRSSMDHCPLIAHSSRADHDPNTPVNIVPLVGPTV